ncbi:glutamate N-acetyltransferase [Natranaerovirga hydrolytica]|uniref:Arginine biosynthesis bifunctional protein ArgJ n=1 Tax=Natranaerovirga hydrolytica TaxID=680378 RepID=A0A4R1N0L9_9FIRM|nr:bifunctional glutamate N-acetyltransferase/amino-acid acetyltransferase ArgJ [Natranaerovirga hydrolytica]TCK98422.1 glutamate N-acetyltransferase [Natranaerovirga hydrolytica]
MKVIDGGITTANGFSAAGIYCGIKKKRKDLALIFSSKNANMAGTFTINNVKAAPVLWNEKLIKEDGEGQAIIINSGVANACTGHEGIENNKNMATMVANALAIDVNKVYVASTGVIGKQLPMDVIGNGIKDIVPKLASDIGSGVDAAEAIMTTDTFKKEIAVEIFIKGAKVKIGSISKGSGMIHPNMATMLAFITTDCNISKDLLKEALKESVQDSYNMISVDGDTSTNDMVLIMANGMADNAIIDTKDDDYYKFLDALNYINIHLAKSVAADGEGATKLLEVNVEGAKDKQQAASLAKSVVGSSLVKTAVHGEDANWGRIICAMGYADTIFNPDEVKVYFETARGNIKIVENGMGTGYSEEEATEILGDKYIKLNIFLQEGREKATAWGCDLSYDYVKINADYRT